MHRIFITFAFLLSYSVSLSVQHVSAQETLQVRYLPPDSEVGYGTDYFTEVLRLSLEKTIATHGEYEMIPSEISMQQVDALRAVRNGQLDVMHTMTDRTRERIFVPARVPLVQGLIGARLFMVNQEDVARWSHVQSTEDLEQIKLGQGADWPDTQILRRSGFNVVGSNTYSELFDMLASHEIDAFPRGAFEIWNEIEIHKDKNFSVADGFFVYYPTAIYFFARLDEDGLELARRIEAGLLEAIEDGSFQELFMEFMGEDIERAGLDDRTVLRIPNPQIPENMPLDNTSLWYISH